MTAQEQARLAAVLEAADRSWRPGVGGRARGFTWAAQVAQSGVARVQGQRARGGRRGAVSRRKGER